MAALNASSILGQTVCVTGAGGFMGSWLVKLLLEKGYTIKGTVRNPKDAKNSHLRELDEAKERLILCKADILDYDSLLNIIKGCNGVFHTACPITNNADQVFDPAVPGTRNVVNAAAEVKVGRLVFTSSIGAVHMNPYRSPDVVVDEAGWSDLDFCRNTENWYCLAKVVAQQTAWELARERGVPVDLVVVIPSVVLGTSLQPTINASAIHILKLLNGANKSYINSVQGYVDVRDVALAHLLVYETPSATGRYLCTESILHRGYIAENFAWLFPAYPIPTKYVYSYQTQDPLQCSDEVNPRVILYKFSNQRLKDLGLKFTLINQCLYDSVKTLEEKGYLSVPPGPLSRQAKTTPVFVEFESYSRL